MRGVLLSLVGGAAVAAANDCGAASAAEQHFLSLASLDTDFDTGGINNTEWARLAAEDLGKHPMDALDDGSVDTVEHMIIADRLYNQGICSLLDTTAAAGLHTTILGYGGANRGHCVGCGKASNLIPALRLMHNKRPRALALLTDAADVLIMGGAQDIIAAWRRMGPPVRPVLGTEYDLTFGYKFPNDFAEAEERDVFIDGNLSDAYKLHRFPNTGIWLGRPRALAGAIFASLGDTLMPNPTYEARRAEIHDQLVVMERWKPWKLPKYIMLDRRAEVIQNFFTFDPNKGNILHGLWNGSGTHACGQVQLPMARGAMYYCCGRPGQFAMNPWPPRNSKTNTTPLVFHFNGPGKRMMQSAVPGGWPPLLGGRPVNGSCAAQVTLVKPPSSTGEQPERTRIPMSKICPAYARSVCISGGGTKKRIKISRRR
eukprot:Hpha_TRINITY_DN35007_c0_g1::TRINITY_DN35007_c0_g1_i1::g.82712::m.82712